MREAELLGLATRNQVQGLKEEVGRASMAKEIRANRRKKGLKGKRGPILHSIEKKRPSNICWASCKRISRTTRLEWVGVRTLKKGSWKAKKL